MPLAQVTPVVVRVVDAPSKETTIADILIGAVGFVGAVLLAALLVGLLFGGLFIAFRKRRERRGGDEPPTLSATFFTR